MKFVKWLLDFMVGVVGALLCFAVVLFAIICSMVMWHSLLN